MKLIDRDSYINRIIPFFNKSFVKVITGMRRTGKSSIIKLLIANLHGQGVSKKDLVYINKESLQWASLANHMDLYRYITEYFKDAADNKTKYVFIDEVQEVDGWERCINSLLADNLCDITITGSNAHLLSSDLATLLSGRYIEFNVYPLTFKEFLKFRNTKATNTELKSEFALFLRYGGLPAIHNLALDDDLIFPYLNSIYHTVILKDVIMRHSLKEPGHLERIVRFVFDNCGNITTAKRISDYLKQQKISASVDKVLNYLAYLEQACIIHKVLRYDIKGMRHLELYEKYYMGDIGLRSGLIGYKASDISGILENVIYLELLHRGYSVTIGKQDDKEVDFIAEKNQEKNYFQIAYILGDKNTIDREFNPLEKIEDNYPKYVLSMDEFQSIDRKGIHHKNIIEFLIEKE